MVDNLRTSEDERLVFYREGEETERGYSEVLDSEKDKILFLLKKPGV